MLMAEMSILMPVDGMWAGDSSESAVRRRLFGRCICLHPPLQRHGGGYHGGAQPGARSWAPHDGKVSYPYLPSLHGGTAQGLARPLCLSRGSPRPQTRVWLPVPPYTEHCARTRSR